LPARRRRAGAERGGVIGRADRDPGRGRLRRWRGFLSGALFALVALVAGQELLNETTLPDRLIAGLLVPDTTGNADAIVVPGAGVTGPCAPNTNAVQRTLHAARAWREGRAPIIVFSGGTGDNPCPIAEAMARLAREIGVPASAIHTERFSRSTYENARLTAPLLRRLGVRRVLVVTDRLHERRAAGAFAAQGFAVERRSVPVYDGHADNTAMLVAGLREYAAVYYYRMRGWISIGRPEAAPQESTATIPLQMQVSHPTGPLVILGASYAGGWRVERIGQHAVINKGVSGEQSFEMLNRFERDVVAASPRAVVLWGFINDIFRATDVEAAVPRIRNSFTKMVALARERGIEPILATEVTIRPPASWTNGIAALLGAVRGKESYQGRINRYVMDTNRWLVDLARREGLLLLDLQSATADGTGMRRPEFAQEDGSHIAARGYQVLTDYAVPLLQQHLDPAK
jgi:uncharacterized SAM-binding protein YcdF (DUF218 family)